MGLSLDLYVEDGSIISPFLPRSFLDEITFEWYFQFSEFLIEEEIKIVSPNTIGEIIIQEKNNISDEDKKRILLKLGDAFVGTGSLEDANKAFDEFLITSDKIEDRERDPHFLKELRCRF